MKFDLCIIDCDPLVYRCGFSVEKYDKEADILTVEPAKHAFYNINSMFRYCLKMSETDNYKGFLTASDKSNFRFQLFPEYKANRKDARRPFYYNEIRDFLVKRWSAEIVSGLEADDACSVTQCAYNPFGFDPEAGTSIVWSFDKDFNNIPGWHGNFVTKEIYYISPLEALKHFYLQILTGDNSDGIPRVRKGWRQKEAEQAINYCTTEEQMLDIVYNVIYTLNIDRPNNREETHKDIYIRGNLVWLRRNWKEVWTPPLSRTLLLNN